MRNKYIREEFKIRKSEYIKRIIIFIVAMFVVATEIFKIISQFINL